MCRSTRDCDCASRVSIIVAARFIQMHQALLLLFRSTENNKRKSSMSRESVIDDVCVSFSVSRLTDNKIQAVADRTSTPQRRREIRPPLVQQIMYLRFALQQ